VKTKKTALHSMDIAGSNRERLRQLFPSIFTEALNDQDELVETVDFEKLKAELGTFTELFDNRRERYGLDWPGKKDALKIIQQPSIATLKPDREESVNFDNTENLFIEGDNLEVLKLLQKSYYGKIKMIYIDPPYNTGNEFIYPDNYTESLDTYLAYAGLMDDNGRKFSTNTQNEGRFHTKWLNMMYPRLYLARNLLREDGVIFISIDDNEVSNLRKVCDEIFGEENFVATVVWQRAFSPINLKRTFSESHDYVVCYCKNRELVDIRGLSRTEESLARYSNPDNDPRGPWTSTDLSVGPVVEEKVYPITLPSGRVVLPPSGRCWVLTNDRFNEFHKDNRIWYGKDGDNAPRVKKFMSEVKQRITPMTFWTRDDVGDSQEATRELKRLFQGHSFFDYPKPVRLLHRLADLSTDTNDIILDFFAGSATTAHAVLELNKDGGNRKFIMVQLPEPCEEKSEAYNAGYRTIADIGKERIRRVIKEIKENLATKRKEAEGTLLGLEKEVPELDLGFKILKLDKSNFKIWDGGDQHTTVEELVKQLDLHIDHIDSSSSQEDILYELLLKAGFMPTEKIEQVTMAGKTVYSISDGSLFICLEDEISKELIDELAKATPKQVICLDHGFQRNDQLKANAVQTFSAGNQEQEKVDQIIFRTV